MGVVARLHLTLSVVAGASLLAAAPASAASPGPEPGKAPASSTIGDVTVEASQRRAPLADPTAQFVREHLPEGPSNQLARFRDGVCVKVIGLEPNSGQFIAQRIAEVARQVKAPVADGDCKPNIHIIFSPQPQAQLDDIAKRRDLLTGFHFPSQFKRLTAVDRPVQAWYVTRTRDTVGNSWIDGAASCPSNFLVDDGACGDRPSGRPGSRLGADLSSEIVHSLILADTRKLADERIEVIADYVAVLALARWQGLEKCNTIPTILNRLAEDCADRPETTTRQDFALLHALYSVQVRALGSQQRATIASAVRRATDDSHPSPAG
ncbi:hypothetical protein [Phenylobacterium sp.]|uniref:hypothetical protein n=1 Tax=Phenylobacterium sp. TaxID=1871053 RepID=UPI002CD31311|nr:hypothetical protein [Phenylobacterium sp.]HLZ74102.1 hypothetical protein [Phenylobacterium sp.]